MFSNENLFNIPHLKLHVKKINRKKKIQYMYSTQNKENLIFFLSLILQFLAFFECIYLGCKIYSSLHSNQSDIVCMWNIGTGKLIIWANKNKYEKHFYRINNNCTGLNKIKHNLFLNHLIEYLKQTFPNLKSCYVEVANVC